MAISPSEIIEVARSREKHDNSGLPFIDLTAIEAQENYNLLVGEHPVEKEPKAFFNAANFKKRNSLIALAVIFALAIGATYSDRIFRGSTIAHGVSVSNVSIGGKTTSSARTTLTRASKNAINKPLVFALGSSRVSISSQDIDLTYDISATLEAARKIDDSFNPLVAIPGFMNRYTTGKNIDPVVDYDDKKFDDAAKRIVNEFSKGRANAGVVIDGTNVRVVNSKSGQGVSLTQARRELKDAVTTFSRDRHTLSSEKVDAQITREEAQRVAGILTTMFSRDSTLTTPAGNNLTITSAQLSSAITLTPKESTLEIGIDSTKMRAALGDQLGTVEVPAVDANFAVSGGTVSVIPSVAGKQIDFNSALTHWIKGQHSFAVGVIEVQPAHNTEWAQKLNITEVVSSFTTNFPAGQERVKNIRRAAEVTNNTVVAPGEIFSLNEKLGRRTAENGYVKAPVYSDADGFFEDYGGGASQFSTTLFNAAFIGGYKDVAHTPHSIFIPRYPMGREATLNYGSIDMSFKNDSNSGILIRTSVGTTSVSVTLYGNKEGRTVSLEGPAELARTEIATEYTDDPNLEVGKEKQTQAGYPGIVVDNFRTVNRPGQPGKRERYRWTYKMVPRKVNRGTKVVATTPPASTPASAPAA